MLWAYVCLSVHVSSARIVPKISYHPNNAFRDSSLLLPMISAKSERAHLCHVWRQCR